MIFEKRKIPNDPSDRPPQLSAETAQVGENHQGAWRSGTKRSMGKRPSPTYLSRLLATVASLTHAYYFTSNSINLHRPGRPAPRPGSAPWQPRSAFHPPTPSP